MDPRQRALRDALRPMDPYDVAQVIIDCEDPEDAKVIAREINRLLRERKGKDG